MVVIQMDGLHLMIRYQLNMSLVTGQKPTFNQKLNNMRLTTLELNIDQKILQGFKHLNLAVRLLQPVQMQRVIMVELTIKQQ